MDKKNTSIIAYFTLIGWIIAFLAGDREGAGFHLNQALVIGFAMLICIILTRIPLVGFVFWIIGAFVLVCLVLGLAAACKGEEKQVPLLGGIRILR